jgi:hypothetical protein
MRKYSFTFGAFAVTALLMAAPYAHARTEVTCLFSWPDNAEANVKGHSQHVATAKKVSTKEYEQIVGKKVAARVSGSGGSHCTLNHPDHPSFDLKIRKDEYRLDPAGSIPNCEDLRATIECKGIETPTE